MARKSVIGVLLCLPWLALVAGCGDDPPLAKTPPAEVIVSQPVKETVTDWDVYTGTVDAKESLEVRSRVRGACALRACRRR